MRRKVDINFEWRFAESFNSSFLSPDFDDSSWETVQLPHSTKEIPFNNFDERIYQGISCYRKSLRLFRNHADELIFINFSGVMTHAEVYLNGQYMGEHKGGYTPFRIDLTPGLKIDSLDAEEENVLVVVVDSTERSDIPPFGFVIDYLTYGGIYREVAIEYLSSIHIQSAMVTSEDVLTDKPRLRVKMMIHHEGGEPLNLDLEALLFQGEIPVHEFSRNWKIDDCLQEIEFCIEPGKIKLWDIDDPNLYHLELNLSVDKRLVDKRKIRFGFREALFTEKGFLLNGRPVKILGLNRHQSFPYTGYAMPRSAQYKDAEILKYDLGLNAVRLSHYPQSDHFMDRCDELGLLVFDELPGWQHIGDVAWQDLALQNIEEMILKDANHPSVIIWGVRINESRDNDAFYTKTNQLAHKLDHSRQTGGVRCIAGSHLLEDVYTYNDFSHTGNNRGLVSKKRVTREKKPYLITEYNGHMYPTKKFDDEQHRINQLKRHLQVMNDIRKDDLISGGFGWCMFDYNTHKEFGSGDKICYHGVLDMFRIPKHAAFAYASQQDRVPVMHIASPMQIGEFEGSLLKDVFVLTNCDSVELYKNGEYIQRFYPREDLYPHLKHPPILIDDFIGDAIENEESFSKKDAKIVKNLLIEINKNGESLSWKQKLAMIYIYVKYRISRLDAEDLYTRYFGGWGGEAGHYSLKGYMGGRCIIEKRKGVVNKPKIVFEVDKPMLIEEETYDVTRCTVWMEDEFGNDIYLAGDPLLICTEGPIEIIGPRLIALTGGSTGFWIKSIGQSGNAKIIISSERFGNIESNITIEKIILPTTHLME